MKIAVLDSQAYLEHPVFRGKNIRVYNEVGDTWKNRSQEKETDLPHGTAVCGILANYTDERVEILNFNIFSPSLPELTRKTLSALQYVYDNVDCDILNLSMGLRVPSDPLKEICQKLDKKGVTIVSAFDNAGAISYPAAYDFVIGVDSSRRCTHADDFVYVENSPVNLRAKGGIQRVPWRDPLYVINQGSSFAAPYVTAYIANCYLDGVSKQEILPYLKSHAKYVYPSKVKVSHKPDLAKQIRRAAIFPFNKEMDSLINYRKRLPFELCAVYDTKYSGHIGLEAKGIFEKEPAFTVQNIDRCDFTGFDTLIIGHISEQEGRANQPIKSRILEKCLEHGIHVYSFDAECMKEFEPRFEAQGLLLQYPKLENMELKNKFGKLYLTKSPVLGVFGTTRKQGKFTVQLQLRYLFEDAGYTVGQLGTEPSSKLFGIDKVFAFGYNPIVSQDQFENLDYVNTLMHQIDEKNPDSLLVGAQSGTIPQGYYNLGQILLEQYAFLLATKPDAVVLVVNVDDRSDYIRRTIMAVQSLVSCRVIALAMYPKTFQNGWGIANDHKTGVGEQQLLARKQELENLFHLPVVVTGNPSDGEKLLNACIDFFRG